MSVKLDVSLGEALDKLTILEIKKNKITDHRQNDIIVEYNYLSEELQRYTEQHKYLYSILYKTNSRIWDCMDIIRDSKKSTSELYDYIDETIVLNDSRYLIKKKINEVCNSKIKEQKGYSIRVLTIILNCDHDMITLLNGAIRYYSFFYDEIVLFSKNENNSYMTQMFHDDKFIKIASVEDELSQNKEPMECDFIKICHSDITLNVTKSFLHKNTDGTHNNKYSIEINNIYHKLGLDASVFDEYNYSSIIDSCSSTSS